MTSVALITGGARGIGLGISRALCAAGIDVALCGRKAKEDISEVLDELKKNQTKVEYYQCDISVTEQRKAMLENIIKDFGKLNVLVNNAGVAPRQRKDILDATEDDFEWLLKINLQAPYFLTQEVSNCMIAQKNNKPDEFFKIINITSVSSELPSVNRGEYCISKAGLSMMTKLYAARLGEYDIPVIELRPGIIKTDMTEKVTEKYDELIARGISLQKRWGMPSDIGKAVSSIVKGDFPFSTGASINIDGGLSLKRL